MTIRERSEYEVSPEVLWPYLVNAEQFVLWNTKLRIYSYQGPFREGMTFGSQYTLGARSTACSSTVLRVSDRELLHLTHRNCIGSEGGSEMEVDETFTLTSRGSSTRMDHVVRVRNHGIPFYVVALITLVTRFGKRKGRDELQYLLDQRPRTTA